MTFTQKRMEKIAEITGLTFDGGDDTRLFADDDRRISVFAKTLGWNQYQHMEKKLSELEIDREKYCVYAWNDISGYHYWKNEELESHSGNYIQITVHIKDTMLNGEELKQLENDVENLYCEFYEFHNIDEFFGNLNRQGLTY